MGSALKKHLQSASSEAFQQGENVVGLRAKLLAALIGGKRSPVGDVAGKILGAGSRGVGALGDAIVAPGGSMMRAVNNATALPTNTTAGQAAKILGLSTPVLGTGVILGMGYNNQQERGDSLRAEPGTNPINEESMIDRMDAAYARGANPMSDPFTSFVQQRKAASEREKTAARAPGQLAGLGMSGLGDVMEKFLFRDVTDKITGDVIGKAVKVKPALGLGAAGLGIMVADDFLDSDPTSPLSYKAKKQMFGLGDRIEAEDTFAENFVAQSGKNTANMLKDLVDHAITGGVNAVKTAPMGIANKYQASEIIANDDVLGRATDSEKDMLHRAFNTMQKYAPTLAGDEFVVKNYLREALMSANGPDYGTVANIAKAESAVGNPYKPTKAK